MTIAGLGIIPSWQFSMDPAVNSKLNPFVSFPAGMTQTTIQPLGPYYSGPEGQLGGSGLGDVSDTVSSIGSFIILALAVYGGWNVFTKIRKHVSK